MLRLVLTLFLFLCAAWAPLMAQSGFVRSGGQPIPGATVTATLDGQKFTTVTDQEGHYQFSSLPEGAGTIEVRMFGFDPASRQVTLGESGKTVDFNLQLGPSPLAQRLSQFAGARAGAQGNNQQLDSEIQNELNSAQAQSPAPAANSESSNESFLVSGSLSQGLARNATPDFGGGPPQMIMLQNGAPGEGSALSAPAQGPAGFGGGGPGFGRGGPGFGGGGPGGGPGGFARRGGEPPPGRGRQFGNRRRPTGIHGMAFFTLNNSALNARPFSISGLDVPQPAYAQSRFSLVGGGPLVIPKLVKDPSTFFFFSYFGARARNPFSAFATVPSALERQGDFSQSVETTGPAQIFDPVKHLIFAGNVIPGGQIDSIAKKLLRFIPFPTSPGLVNNYAFHTSAPQNTDNFGLRLQRSLRKSDRLAYQINLQRREGRNTQPFQFVDTTGGQGLTTNLQWTHNFTTRLISNARLSFNRNRNEVTPFFAFGPDVAAQLGIAGTSGNPVNFGPPNLNFTNFGALSDASPVLTRNQGQSFGDNLILVRGKHTFTFGMEYRRTDLNTRTDQNGRGTFNFTGLATSAFDARGFPISTTGYDFADFLLGLPQSSSIRYGASSTYFAQNVWTGFVNDDWKVRPNLTLNAGLRYEYFSPFFEKRGRIANLDIAPGYTAVAVVTPGERGPYTGPFPSGLIDPDYGNISPRLGLAWKVPRIKRSTIVRAGYGIYYNGQAYQGFALKLAQQPPFAVSNSVNTGPQNILTLAGGFVATLPTDVTNTYAVDRFYRTPYAQTWNLSIQHELPAGFYVDLGYLGTKGTHLDVQTLPNQGPPGSLTSQARSQLARTSAVALAGCRPAPCAGLAGNAVGFVFDSSNGNSVYHALQVRAARRFRGGISMNAFYQYAKSIDDSSTFGGAGNTVAQNWLDLSAERGLSSFDRRHTFDWNWVLSSQAGAGRSRFAPDSPAWRFLKDWQLTGSITAQTGTPLTARVLGNTARLAQTGGVGSGRADATSLPVLSGSGFFNPAAFTVPPPGQFGNAGRNTIPGPGLFSLNLGFGRSFQLGTESRRHFELRMEANNVLNHVNYTNINSVVNAINYGVPISAGAMRTVNTVVRFRF